jgi:hypothetical protein
MKITARPRSVREIVSSVATVKEWHALRTYLLAQFDWMASRNSRRSEQFGEPVPWWAYSCTAFLDQVVPIDASVLELGTGGSTLWWLGRGNSVTAAESSPEWAERIRADAVGRAGALRLIDVQPDDRQGLRSALGELVFDVVVVDHSGDRVGAIEHLIDRVDAQGMLILDNSDRVEYAAGLERLRSAGFSLLDFAGLTPINAFAGTTTVAFRSEVRVQGRRVEFATVDN